jgi:hypothetical protein
LYVLFALLYKVIVKRRKWLVYHVIVTLKIEAARVARLRVIRPDGRSAFNRRASHALSSVLAAPLSSTILQPPFFLD